jgi:hypothetical protein
MGGEAAIISPAQAASTGRRIEALSLHRAAPSSTEPLIAAALLWAGWNSGRTGPAHISATRAQAPSAWHPSGGFCCSSLPSSIGFMSLTWTLLSILMHMTSCHAAWTLRGIGTGPRSFSPAASHAVLVWNTPRRLAWSSVTSRPDCKYSKSIIVYTKIPVDCHEGRRCRSRLHVLAIIANRLLACRIRLPVEWPASTQPPRRNHLELGLSATPSRCRACPGPPTSMD